MRKLILSFLLSAILAAPAVLSAGELTHEMKPGSPQFEKMKRLTGTWEGKVVGGAKEKMGENTKLEYSLTSGGSALVEKLSPGEPHEMVSIYHDKKGKLNMTHYCMMGNQPVLELKDWDEKKIELDLAKNSGIDPKENHMHKLVIEFKDNDHFTQKWTNYVEGKPGDTLAIDFARVPAK